MGMAAWSRPGQSGARTKKIRSNWRHILFAAYSAALDREELAATRYSGVIRRTSPA
jgi:hypothetical protein